MNGEASKEIYDLIMKFWIKIDIQNLKYYLEIFKIEDQINTEEYI